MADQLEALPWNTIPEIVEVAIERFGDLEAIVDGSQRLTFAEVGAQIHRAARALIATGISPGDRVGLWAPNIHEWVVAALATHSVGAVLVPINTRFKGREAAYVLRKARVRLLFTVTGFLDNDYIDMLYQEPDLPELDEIVVLRQMDTGDRSAFSDFLARGDQVSESLRRQRAQAVRPEDVCHILFTSGTTGAPKGAMLEHGTICRAYSVYSDQVGLRTGDRYLIVLPFFHSFGLHSGILCCFMHGATIVPELTFDVDAVIHRIVDERITAFPGAPSVYQAILNSPAVDRGDLDHLRLAVVSAAAIPVELIENMRARLSLECIITGYGLTESSGLVAMCHHDDAPDIVARTAGRPIPGVEVRIVGPDGTAVGADVAGEIQVRGYNIMRGYLDDPERTAEVIDRDGWLHTGDIGKIRPDGNLVITDRLTDMFIVGGFNAYPAEIESLISNYPSVSQVAVVGIPDPRLGEVGVAFVVPRAGGGFDADHFAEWCGGNLANYKVPRHTVIVDELPLNATGKVLKFQLRQRAKESFAAES